MTVRFGGQTHQVRVTVMVFQPSMGLEAEAQKRILRLTTPKLKKALGAPFAQDASSISSAKVTT